MQSVGDYEFLILSFAGRGFLVYIELCYRTFQLRLLEIYFSNNILVNSKILIQINIKTFFKNKIQIVDK